MLNGTAVDLPIEKPLMKSAVLVSQFLQLYLKKDLASYILHNEIAIFHALLSEFDWFGYLIN